MASKKIKVDIQGGDDSSGTGTGTAKGDLRFEFAAEGSSSPLSTATAAIIGSKNTTGTGATTFGDWLTDTDQIEIDHVDIGSETSIKVRTVDAANNVSVWSAALAVSSKNWDISDYSNRLE